MIRTLYRWIPIAIFSYLFSMFFVPRYTPFADRARSHAMFTMWDGNHQWRNVNPMSKNDEVRLLGLSRDVCEPMVGSVDKDSWWTNHRPENFQLFSWFQLFLLFKFTHFLLFSAQFELFYLDFKLFFSFFEHFQCFWQKVIFMSAIKKSCFCPLSRKTRRVQWLFYFNALSLPNHVCM